jgi:hypothetical protein
MGWGGKKSLNPIARDLKSSVARVWVLTRTRGKLTLKITAAPCAWLTKEEVVFLAGVLPISDLNPRDQHVLIGLKSILGFRACTRKNNDSGSFSLPVILP